MDLPHQFKYPWIPCAGDRPEGGTAETSVGIGKRRRVRNVEAFHSQLEPHSLTDRERLTDHEIRILKAWPADRVARTVADHELRDSCEGRSIEVLRRTTVFKIIRIGDAIGPLDGKSKARVVVGRLTNNSTIRQLLIDHISA